MLNARRSTRAGSRSSDERGAQQNQAGRDSTSLIVFHLKSCRRLKSRVSLDNRHTPFILMPRPASADDMPAQRAPSLMKPASNPDRRVLLAVFAQRTQLEHFSWLCFWPAVWGLQTRRYRHCLRRRRLPSSPPPLWPAQLSQPGRPHLTPPLGRQHLTPPPGRQHPALPPGRQHLAPPPGRQHLALPPRAVAHAHFPRDGDGSAFDPSSFPPTHPLNGPRATRGHTDGADANDPPG